MNMPIHEAISFGITLQEENHLKCVSPDEKFRDDPDLFFVFTDQPMVKPSPPPSSF